MAFNLVVTNRMKKFQNFFWIAVGIASIGFFIYKVAKRAIINHILENNAQHIKAIIINDKNYEPNQPVSAGFNYSYEFRIENKRYTGNSHDESVKIGDTIEVEYSKEHPDMNKPLYPKD